MICNRRTRVFNDDGVCQKLTSVINEIRAIHHFKLLSYVFMPDHVHAIINPLRPDVSKILNKIKGKSARLILDLIIERGSHELLDRLRLDVAGRRFALWQTRSSVIDLISAKFVIQKTRYIHFNPVRAGLCEHPKDWKWSSYRAMHPANEKPLPIKVDFPSHWREEEIRRARGTD